MMQHAKQHDVVALVALVMVMLGALPAAAQAPFDPNAGRITAAARIEFLNAYSFRGIRQDDTGVVVWPQVDLGVRLFTGDGTVNSLTVHAGAWNSVHSGVAGSEGPSGDPWYESDLRAGLDLAMARGLIIGATYTAYVSPNDTFTTVKELSLRLALDQPVLGAVALRPYALFAFELDTQPGIGQADGGFEGGRYLEVGATPSYSARALEIAIPVKVGLSLSGYYELAGRDRRFGYVSAAGLLTVPLGARSRLGAWSLRGGVEYQRLGAMPKVINGSDDSQVIGSVGVEWLH